MKRSHIVAALLIVVTITARHTTGVRGQASMAPSQTPLSGSLQPPLPANSVVVGQVVDAAVNKPIGGAVVSLFPINPPRPPLPPGVTLSPAEQAAIQAANAPRRIMTDGSGAFAFNSLPKGSYRLQVDAPGFMSGGYGQTRPNGSSKPFDLDPGERRSGMVVKMWPWASITGTVTDDSGDPVVGFSVRLLSSSTGSGPRRYFPSSGVQTDDRGVFRFAQLSPGEYLVAVPQTVTSLPMTTVDAYTEALRTPNGPTEFMRAFESSGMPPPYSTGVRVGNQQVQLTGGMTRSIAPPTTNSAGKTFAYATVFYPSAATVADATPLTLAAGQERSGIDIQVRTVPTVRVSGVVTGPEGPASNIGIKLLAGGIAPSEYDNGFETGTTASDASGAFTFPAVPAGSYTLRVVKVPRPAPMPVPITPVAAGRGNTPPSPPPPPPVPVDPVLWAEVPVSTADTDVTGVTVILRPGARISGRVVFEGAAQQPTGDQLQRMTISVNPIDGRPSIVNSIGRATAAGQFTTPGYPPGRYAISAGGNVPGWYFKSATIGGRSIDEEGLDLGASDIAGVTITYTDRTTQITGTVRDPSATRDLNATVVIFPANYASWIDRGLIGRRSRQMGAAGTGVFQVGGLPPGDYLAVAVSADLSRETSDRAYYDTLARAATRFTLTDGEKKSLDLTVSQIR